VVRDVELQLVSRCDGGSGGARSRRIRPRASAAPPRARAPCVTKLLTKLVCPPRR
jgi:hypothetical protein